MGETFSRRSNDSPILKYNKRTGKWQNDIKPSKRACLHSQLTVVTYNVWFEPEFYDQRCEQIFKILECNKIDIICLQEVTSDFVDKLKKQTWVQDLYYISNMHSDPTLLYGCLMLSSLCPMSIRRWSLPSFMGRDCLVGEYIINGEQFIFTTVHLESLNFSQKRREQLERISNSLRLVPNVILMGDFNFDSNQNYSQVEEKREALKRGISVQMLEEYVTHQLEPLENEVLKNFFPEFLDIWSESGLVSPEEKGYTYDSVENNMIKQYERMRYDRMLLKSENGIWEPKGISLLGNRPLDARKVGGSIVFPSDHFGLIMTIERVIKNK